MRGYKSYLKARNTTGEGAKIFPHYEDMSVELASRPDITPLVLKGTNVKPEEKPEAKSPTKSGNSDTPTKKRKLEKADKIDKLNETH